MPRHRGVPMVSGGAITAMIAFVVMSTGQAWAGGPGFRTQHLLEEHFARYGREFGHVTQDQYLRMAQQLRDSRPGKNILMARRPSGGGSKFDRRSGWFVSYEGDGTIRTFFVPKEGVRYFERQGSN